MFVKYVHIFHILVLQFRLAHYWKANEVHDVKDAEKKNIQNKAVQTKLNLYINKYMKKETLQIF